MKFVFCVVMFCIFAFEEIEISIWGNSVEYSGGVSVLCAYYPR